MAPTAAERDEELFKKFFNEETALVDTLDFMQLEERIKDMELIAFEARTRLTKLTGERRERVARMSREDRERLITNPDFTASEKSKLVVPKRAKTTKADKVFADLAKLLGGDEKAAEIFAKGNIIDTEKEKTLIDKRGVREAAIADAEKQQKEEDKELAARLANMIFSNAGIEVPEKPEPKVIPDKEPEPVTEEKKEEPYNPFA